MLSEQLEIALGHAVSLARKERHEVITVEHLLLTLLDDRETRHTLISCGGNIEQLRKSLTGYLKTEVSVVPEDSEPLPGTGFQRVLQRAIMHVQSSGNKEVKGNNVLVAVFGEKESFAVYFLSQQEITRYDVVNFISHGVTKISETGRLPSPEQSDEYSVEEPEDESEGPLEAYTVNFNKLAMDGEN